MQIMCKYGAHRALRYGDGNYEITEVQKHLTEVPEAAAKEVERVQREEPKFSKEDGKLGKPGTCREMSPELKHCASMISKEDPQKLEAASPECLSPLLDAIATIEVDLGINSADQSTNIDPPKSDYRLPGHWTHESKRQGVTILVIAPPFLRLIIDVTESGGIWGAILSIYSVLLLFMYT